MEWNYGNAYLQHPIEKGTAVFENGSRLKTHDIFNHLPEWMNNAEMIFTDAPWNKGNLTSFYTKADMMNLHDYDEFYRRMFDCVRQIKPSVCYLEIGKQYLADFIVEMRKIYRNVTFYNSTYYHRKDCICYVVRGANKKPIGIQLDGVDEEDIISKIIEAEPVESVADLCMGRGLVALAAQKFGKTFYGTELNHKRLSVALQRLSEVNAKYRIEEN